MKKSSELIELKFFCSQELAEVLRSGFHHLALKCNLLTQKSIYTNVDLAGLMISLFSYYLATPSHWKTWMI